MGEHRENKTGECYKHTGKDKDYEAYKEALTAATNEVRMFGIRFDH